MNTTDLSSFISGLTVPKLNQGRMREIPIPVPPLAEQRRIVGILDEAFAGIARAVAATEKNLANARELFECKLNAVFTRKGDEWIEGLLANVVLIKHGFAFKSEYFVESGNYVLLTPGNFFESGGYRDRGERQKYYDGEIPNGYVLKRGDLLMAMTEQAAGLLGSSIIVPADGTFLHNQRLGLLVPHAGVPWHNRFFFHLFNTREFRNAAHDSASGVKVRHTSPVKLGQIQVAYPKKLEDQEQIAEELDELNLETQRLESLYRRKLAALAELKQALLQKAFVGELTGDAVEAVA